MASFRLLSVNWKDGMLIEAGHFLDQEAYFEEMVRWSLAHSLAGYGLVPPASGQPDPLVIELESADGQLNVRLRRCLAVLPSGWPIHVDSDSLVEEGGTPPVEGRFPLPRGQRQILPLSLEAVPGAKVEVGPVDREVEPPRAAYRASALRLSIDEQEGPPPAWGLPLAEIEVEGGRVALRETYIPPCLTTGAHPALRVKTKELLETLHGLAENATSVAVQQASSGEAGRPPGLTPLARFSRDLALRASIEFSSLHDGRHILMPAEVSRCLKRLLRYARILLDLQPEVLRGSWHDYLSMAPEGIKDHGIFVRRVEEVLAQEHRPNHLREEYTDLSQLLGVLGGFAVHLRGGGIKDIPPADLVYEREPYAVLKWSQIQHSRDGGWNMVEISGFEPLRCAKLLAWIRIPTSGSGGMSVAEMKSLARNIRLGINEVKGFGAMDKVPVDVEFDQKASVIVLYNRNQESIGKLNIKAGSAFDFSALSQIPNEDIRLYCR